MQPNNEHIQYGVMDAITQYIISTSLCSFVPSLYQKQTNSVLAVKCDMWNVHGLCI